MTPAITLNPGAVRRDYFEESSWWQKEGVEDQTLDIVEIPGWLGQTLAREGVGTDTPRIETGLRE